MNPPTDIELAVATGWGSEALYKRGEDYFDTLLADLATATVSIDLETYIFEQDALGSQVADALLAAHRRGVRVRVLMDGAGSWRSSGELAERLETAGIEVKIFHPLPWQIHHYQRAAKRGNWLDKAIFFFRRINQRDHRKLCLIDSQRLWSGSFNISAVHLSRARGGAGWRDYGLCVSGPVVSEVGASFDSLWRRGAVRLGRGLFRLYWDNLSHSARRWRNQLLLQHIHQARRRVWIVSAYFAPARRVVRALANAREKGVDVRLIVPHRSDIALFPPLTATYYADLLRYGVRVYEYQPAMIHAKAVIIDDLHLIGSTNFNHRSFLHDLELDIQLHQSTSQATLRRWFRQDLEASVEVTPRSQRPLTQRLLGYLARLLRYWM